MAPVSPTSPLSLIPEELRQQIIGELNYYDAWSQKQTSRLFSRVVEIPTVHTFLRWPSGAVFTLLREWGHHPHEPRAVLLLPASPPLLPLQPRPAPGIRPPPRVPRVRRLGHYESVLSRVRRGPGEISRRRQDLHRVWGSGKRGRGRRGLRLLQLIDGFQLARLRGVL